MKLSIRLIASIAVGLTSLSASALEKVEPVKPIHTNKAILMSSIEEALKVNVETISAQPAKRVILLAKEDKRKATKTKAKTNAFSIAE